MSLKTYLDCLPCLMNQALKAARASTNDEVLHRKVINAIAGMIPELPLGIKTPEITQRGYRLINEITGNNDPFRQAKAEANRAVLAVYPRLQRFVQQSKDRLFAAFCLAITGNTIDLGPKFDYGSVESIIDTALVNPVDLVINHYDQLRENLGNCRRIIYLGDNAGEIVFDRLLIEEINRIKKTDIYFVVRGKPVINDATMDDAITIGMDKIARVIPNGSDAPGTILTQCSKELQQLYQSADIIIAKGQGNYESLEGEPGNIFFLLKAKCPMIANSLGVSVGDCVFKQQISA